VKERSHLAGLDSCGDKIQTQVKTNTIDELAMNSSGSE